MKESESMHHLRPFTVALTFVFLSTIATAQDVGPANGSLVVVGGAMKDPAIMERFIELAGGPEAPIVVIPTAGGGEEYDDFYSGARRWRDMGVMDVTVLHTKDRDEADSDRFVSAIRRARGVWFPGGRQWRLADSYLDTKTEREFHALLARGGVIGGSSAGATIQGSYLVRGDTKTNTIMMGDHERGFAFLKDVGIDQHLLVRNRQFDLIDVIKTHPELLGIGIDEDTAIVVRGDSFEVMGQGYVAIYDNGRMLTDHGHFYFLRPGDTYNMKTREPQRRVPSTDPFNIVEQKSWR